MSTIKYFFSLAFLLCIFVGCKKEINNSTAFVEAAAAPEKLSAMFDITQDNTGNVTITPNGTGAVTYDVYFGDGTTAPAKVAGGKNVVHKYAEGVYNVKLVGYAINGKTTEATQQLTVSFRAPENLEFTVTVDPLNSMKVSVTAKALYETNFKVYFADVPNEIPVSFLEGETVTHTYAAVGTYQVKVVAFSGGSATTELIKPVTIVNPVLLPITFESPTVDYSFTNFGGGVVTTIANPQINGINTSAKVGRMVKNADQVYGGSLITLGAPINFSANKVVRMKVFSPRVGAKVLFKVENLTNGGISFEKEVSTTLANTWEDLVFDFSAINTSNTYQKIVLIFDNGTMGNGSANFTFLFDDIRLTNTLPSSLLTLPITFDDPNIIYNTIDFGNNITVQATDPVVATNKVRKTTKPNGAETWAGTTLGQLASALPFTASSAKMSVRIYAPAAGLPILLKVEDRNDPTKSVETLASTTIANGWQTLEFNFANQAPGTAALNLSYTYNMISIFFDFGTVGSGKIFYWDDVSLVTGGGAATLALPLNFESATLNYAFTNFDGGNVTVINNPQVNGINTSNKVAQMVKGAGQPYGGSFITLGSAINFTSTTLRMKVFSPRVGAKVLLKVENSNNTSQNFEKEVSMTVANTWEDLSFNFSGINLANPYNRVVIIFELGTVGDGSANFTFLFDDIRVN